MKTTEEMRRRLEAVAKAWAGYEHAVNELQTFALECKKRAKPARHVDPAKLIEVRARAIRVLKRPLSPKENGLFNSAELAIVMRNTAGLSAKAIEDNYLPALRTDFPHCVKSGRTWLWYWNAAASRDPEAKS